MSTTLFIQAAGTCAVHSTESIRFVLCVSEAGTSQY